MSSGKRSKAKDADLKLLRRYTKRHTAKLEKRRQLILSREDVEDVHKMRVATRRLRAALALLEDKRSKTAKDVRWLTRKLGAVRDLDVLMLELGDSPTEQRYHQYLHQRWQKNRRRLLRALKSKRVQRLLEGLNDLRDALVTRKKRSKLDLHGTIAAELENVRHAGNRIKADAPFERLHRLRIRCKRLRYQLEILHPQADTPMAATLDTLKMLLEQLGQLQDTRIAVAYLLAYEETLEPDDEDHRHLAQLIRHQDRLADNVRLAFPAVWQRFDKALDQGLAELEKRGVN